MLNKNKILLEGKYDSLVSNVVKDIMDLTKKSYGKYVAEKGGRDNNYPDQDNDEDYYDYTINISKYPQNKFDLDFPINVYFKRIKMDDEKDGIDFGGGWYDKQNAMEVIIVLDPRKEPSNYSDLVGILKDIVRHELEHALQTKLGEFTSEEDLMLRALTSYPENTWYYYILPEEIPAMVRGLYIKAKNNKTSFKEESLKYLKQQMNIGNIPSTTELKKIYRIWKDYYNKSVQPNLNEMENSINELRKLIREEIKSIQNEDWDWRREIDDEYPSYGKESLEYGWHIDKDPEEWDAVDWDNFRKFKQDISTDFSETDFQNIRKNKNK